MKKYKSCMIPIEVLLFPEIFDDAVDALLKYMPFLQMPCMHKLLVEKAVFFTMFAVSSSNEKDWDIKEEYGDNVSMYISFEEEPSLSPEIEWVEEVRKYTNYSYLEKMISDYARSFAASRAKLTLNHRK